MKNIILLFFLTLFIIVILLFFVYTKQNSSVSFSLPQLVCPVPKEYCTKGKIIKVKGQFAGIGYSVPVGVSIHAIFNGGLRPGWAASSNGRKPLIFLENKSQQIEAVYQITGQDFTQYEVAKQGEKIAEAKGGNIDPSGVNLIIYIRRLDNKTNSIIPVKPSDFISL